MKVIVFCPNLIGDTVMATPAFRALRRGLAGATVLKGIAGFGPDSIIHTASLFRLSPDLPIIIEIVDTEERLQTILPEIDRRMSGGLITMEKVRVVRYERTDR